MNKPRDSCFAIRQTVTLELPLVRYARIQHPEQVIIKMADYSFDVGALCYALRSDKGRKPGRPQEVVISSFMTRRPKQVVQLINALSSLSKDSGYALSTTRGYASYIGIFVEWADANELYNCLAGGEASRDAFRAWAHHEYERYRRQEIGAQRHNAGLHHVCRLLEAMTGLENLSRGLRWVRRSSSPDVGTEPLGLCDFAHVVALNQSIFEGLCNLVLEVRPFPYKLELPGSLGWTEDYLWLFPTNVWLLPPHLARTHPFQYRAYDYAHGRLATADEIEHTYKGASREERLHVAKGVIRRASARLKAANSDARDIWRLTLGNHAQRAFLFLFLSNTGGNQQVIRSLETNGTIEVNTTNQTFRTIKWRARGKEVTLVVPVTFMPHLRRFMELRRYLLQGRKSPYLFFSCGNRNNMPPGPIRTSALENHQKELLNKIDPHLPSIKSRKLRASVDDYYLRFHDSVVAAAVMGHSVETEQNKYARGSANDHHEDMTVFMSLVSESARRQRVITLTQAMPGTRPLEQGGCCDSFGNPEEIVVHSPIQPDCKNPQGCLFCHHRILIAEEEDVRKIASAAYVMEQLILGPKHEEALRPLISKCDHDLEKIATFPNCRPMVETVRKEVYESENLTPFWADKYQLFMELGIL